MFFGNFGAPIVESFENDETKNDTCSKAMELAVKVCKREDVEEDVSTNNVEDDHESFDNGEEELDTEDGEGEEVDTEDGSEVEDTEEVEEDKKEENEEENDEADGDEVEEEGFEPFTVEGFKNNNNSCFLCLNTDQLLRSVLYGCLFFILSHPQTHSKLFKMLNSNYVCSN